MSVHQTSLRIYIYKQLKKYTLNLNSRSTSQYLAPVVPWRMEGSWFL
jgi:hypothetical protein